MPSWFLALLALLSNALGWHHSGMNDVTRYRLIGSVFLLALAAIFLPMIFDARAPLIQGINGVSTSPTSETSEVAPNALNVRDDVQDMIAELQQEHAALDQAFADSDMQAKVDSMRDKVDADGYWVENGTRFGEPILAPVRDTSEIFAVQLATFDEQTNARKLRAQLRKAGAEAFISQYKQRGISGEKIRYRVAVGPLLSHTLAKEKQVSYTQTYGVEAIVVAMSE